MTLAHSLLVVVFAGCGAAAPDVNAGPGTGGSALDGGRPGGLTDAGAAMDAGVDDPPLSAGEQACLREGWRRQSVQLANTRRALLWRGPPVWSKGAIVLMHGGGGRAEHFCAGGLLVQPQVAFAAAAVAQGFAVFALDSTDGVVTDAQGRPCGKRFDFSVLPRPNVDLPFFDWATRTLVPSVRPPGSRPELFVAGLSTGGAMTIRAASTFDDRVTAFAPLSAVDPYGTDAVCDPALSPRESAIGILVDRETGLEIVLDGVCTAPAGFSNESPWATTGPARRPPFKQFHDLADGIVDQSCMRKAQAQLVANGYSDRGPALLDTPGGKNALNHLWRQAYNAPLLGFFASFTP
ncbi:MAG: hypothetical protein JNJ54_36790 [Myxococcaceae bacterium]|nr:hypothetical protein [Myxococcaceae bacterium]